MGHVDALSRNLPIEMENSVIRLIHEKSVI